jgi:AGZA family xanthine/uracil permease-like MFS transporter
MMRQVININWRYIGDAVPAFVTIMFIPFGYSAAYGLIAGLMTYTALNGLIYITKLVTQGYLVPDDEDHREYWTVKPQGKLPCFITATRLLARGTTNGDDDDVKDTDSVKSGESRERFHAGGQLKDSNLDLGTILVEPREEKVLRKI